VTFRSAASQITSHFSTQWAAAHASLEWDSGNWGDKPASVAVIYENQSYEPAGKPYLRLEMLDGDSWQASLGGPGTRRFRNPGLVLISILVPAGYGDDIPRQWADKVVTIWRAQKVGDLQFRTPFVDRIGPAGGAWWQLNVWCPYYWDELG
jgi:hypothetical protein